MNNSNLQNFKDLLPQFVNEADLRGREFERSKKISNDFADKLKDAGAYKILLPKDYGGIEGNLVDWFDMGMELSQADASTGWAVMHGAGANAILQSLGPRDFVKKVFSDPKACCAWSNALTRYEIQYKTDGVLVNSRWSYCTGCLNATYLGGALPIKGIDGIERTTVLLAPKEKVKVIENWSTMGLSGTGSHDIEFNDIFIPYNELFYWPDGNAIGTYPWAICSPGIWFISTCASAVNLGLTKRIIKESRKILCDKKDRHTGKPVISNPAILRVLEKSEGTLLLLTHGMRSILTDLWKTACNHEVLNDNQRLVARNTTSACVHLNRDLVRSIFDISGTAALGTNKPIERLFRDANCLSLHRSTSDFAFEATGLVKAGFNRVDSKI